MQSVAEISERIGKSIPLVTKVLNELTEEGYAVECGHGASTGGRRAMQFALNNNLGYIIAVAIDQYSIAVSAFDLSNRQVLEEQRSSIRLWEDADVYEKLVGMLEATFEKVDTTKVLAIGITLPGFVDASNGLHQSFEIPSPLYEIRDNIQNHFRIRTYIENDSSAIAIAERCFGVAKDVSDALVINLNWGVGLGMIIQGKLFRGHSGFAGEFSHIPLANEDKLCSCGKKGCLEVEASLLCVFEDVEKALKNGERSWLEGASLEDYDGAFSLLLEAFEKGDQLTIRTLKRIAHMLGKGISTLIHILNPEKIVISGKGAVFGDVLIPQIQSSIQEFCIPRLAKQTTIEISTIKHVQLLSSACIAVRQMKWVTEKKTQLN